MCFFQLFRFLGGTVLAAFWLALRRFKLKHPKFLVWDLASGHLPSWIYKSWVPHPHLENVASHEISYWTSLTKETWKLLMHHTCVSLIKPTTHDEKKRNNLGTMIWNDTNEQHFRNLAGYFYTVQRKQQDSSRPHIVNSWIGGTDLQQGFAEILQKQCLYLQDHPRTCFSG